MNQLSKDEIIDCLLDKINILETEISHYREYIAKVDKILDIKINKMYKDVEAEIKTSEEKQ